MNIYEIGSLIFQLQHISAYTAGKLDMQNLSLSQGFLDQLLVCSCISHKSVREDRAEFEYFHPVVYM